MIDKYGGVAALDQCFCLMVCAQWVTILTRSFVLVLQGDVEAVKELLDQGADPNQKDNAGWTPLVRQNTFQNLLRMHWLYWVKLCISFYSLVFFFQTKPNNLKMNRWCFSYHTRGFDAVVDSLWSGFFFVFALESQTDHIWIVFSSSLKTLSPQLFSYTDQSLCAWFAARVNHLFGPFISNYSSFNSQNPWLTFVTLFNFTFNWPRLFKNR